MPGKSHGQKSLVGYSPWGCRVGHECAERKHKDVVSILYVTPSSKTAKEIILAGFESSERGLKELKTVTDTGRMKMKKKDSEVRVSKICPQGFKSVVR